jgi:hypothetical protein
MVTFVITDYNYITNITIVVSGLQRTKLHLQIATA